MTAPERDRDAVARVVCEVIEGVLPGVRLDEAARSRHLKELGADSVDRVEILLTCLDRLRVRQPMSAFSAAPHIDALVDHLWKAPRS